MEKEPKISVVIPCWNAEKTIAETLESVLNQTYKNLEVIVVDDCSTDSTVQIVDNYAKQDNRIKHFVNEKNVKVAQTRNVAIEKATGKYIAFVDSDDVWFEDKLEKQISFMEDKNCQITYTSSVFMDDNSQLLDRSFIVPEKVNYKQLLKQNVINFSSACVLTELAKKHPMKHSELHEDYIFWLEMLKEDVEFAYGIKDVLVKHRLTSNSKTRNKFKSIKMTYKTYRFMGLGFFGAIYNLHFSIFRGLKKYGKYARRK